MKRIAAGILGLTLVGIFSSNVYAQSAEKVLRIGVLGDESGPFAYSGGLGTVYAAELAAQDFGGAVLGRKSRSFTPTTRINQILRQQSHANGSTWKELASSSISRLRPWRLPFRRSRENVAGVH